MPGLLQAASQCQIGLDITAASRGDNGYIHPNQSTRPNGNG
jgi:hypothetical protein